MPSDVQTLETLQTPCLLLDEARLRTNVSRMKARAASLGVAFRPHLKTAKSLDVARIAMTSPGGPAMVSTLREAEYFADGGVRDLIYGVGIAPAKLARVSAIRSRGVDLAIILDSLEQAEAVAAHARSSGDALPVLIEVDADGHRSGVAPTDKAALVAIGRCLTSGNAVLRGVLLHAGDSYSLSDRAALAAAAEHERVAAVTAANVLRSTALPCPVVSVGSTPTACYAGTLEGVTEVRAGVFMIGDLFQAGVGSVAIDDIALTALATVIGHQRAKGWIITDAGWMALSRDRGTARQKVDQGYGLVCDLAGRPYGDVIVADANQEHGIVALRRDATAALPDLPVGSRVRIQPNHACATGAQHDRYHVLDATGAVSAVWPRINGWCCDGFDRSDHRAKSASAPAGPPNPFDRFSAGLLQRAPAPEHHHAAALVRPDHDAGETANVRAPAEIERRQNAGWEIVQCLDRRNQPRAWASQLNGL